MAKVSKSFLAKYPGRCPKCNTSWKRGIDWLQYVDSVLQHVKCPTVNQSALGTSVKTAVNYQAAFNVPVMIEDTNFDLIQSIADNAEETETRENVKSFIPSQYQQAIFDFISNGQGHAVIEAVAGSGKTTTIVHALDLTPVNAAVAFVAFNKHIADELKKRAPSHVHVSTLHSLGYSIFRKAFPKAKIEKDKVGILLDDIYPVSKQALEEGKITETERKINFIKRLSTRKLVSICKSVLVDTSKQEEILDVIDRYGVEIDTDFQDELIKLLPEIMQQCKERTDILDFDDMIWLPVVLQLETEKLDYLMVDEAQDMNKCQIALILSLISDTGRIIAVGDRFQSLYGFRGADTNAIQNIIDALHATVLPLSVTYRCPSLHVDLAKQLVPQLEARDNAPAGTIEHLDYFNLAMRLQPGDMVICRTNAPLIKPAFECIRMGKKAMIRGADIGESLVNLIKRFETNDIGQFEISLAEYFQHEYTKLLDKGKEMQALLLQDRVETLRFILNECSSVAELISKIDMLFSDNNIGIVFSSVHRAKGLEASNVFILRPDLMPHKKAKKDWEQQQELNCKYVAQTRSKENLFFVEGGVNV
jgi:DNA helicase II / ATP-dependent DNA helicase PcrA